MSKYDENKQLKCSFCGKPQTQVNRLVAGPGVYICDDCIHICMDILNENIQEERKEDTFFPSKIIGNVEKKGRLLGLNNPRYLELDCIKGLIKRYKSTDDYPEKPK